MRYISVREAVQKWGLTARRTGAKAMDEKPLPANKKHRKVAVLWYITPD